MKPIRLIPCILAAVILFSGCARMEISYVIEEDGRIEASYLLAVEEQNASRVDIKDLMDAAQQQAEINGFSLDAYEDNGYAGFLATKTITIEDLRKADKDMLGFSTLPSIITDYSWYYEPSVFQNLYQIRMAVDLRNLVENEAIHTLPSDLKELAQEAIENSTLKVHFTLPGQADRTNAHETSTVNDKNTMYSWSMKPGEFKTLTIDATLDKNSTRSQFIWGARGFIALLILSVFFIITRKIKKG